MTFFKRVEVWVLLLLTLGGVVAVLRMDQSDNGKDGRDSGGSNSTATTATGTAKRGDSDDESASAPPYRISALQIERDGEYAVVEIRLTSEQDVAAKKIRLLRSDGSEVAEFFVPSAATSSSVDGVRELLFWADGSTLAGELFLEIDGERLRVKGDDGFQLEAVKDGGRKVLS